jgi:hypothetical protein
MTVMYILYIGTLRHIHRAHYRYTIYITDVHNNTRSIHQAHASSQHARRLDSVASAMSIKRVTSNLQKDCYLYSENAKPDVVVTGTQRVNKSCITTWHSHLKQYLKIFSFLSKWHFPQAASAGFNSSARFCEHRNLE